MNRHLVLPYLAICILLLSGFDQATLAAERNKIASMEPIPISWQTERKAEYALGDIIAGTKQHLRFRFDMPVRIVSEGNVFFSCGCMNGKIREESPEHLLFDLDIVTEREAGRQTKKVTLTGKDANGEKFEANLLITYNSQLAVTLSPNQAYLQPGARELKLIVNSGALDAKKIEGLPKFDGPWIKSVRFSDEATSDGTTSQTLLAEIDTEGASTDSALHFFAFKIESQEQLVTVPIMITLGRPFSISNSKVRVRQNEEKQNEALIFLRGLNEAIPDAAEKGSVDVELLFQIDETKYRLPGNVKVSRSGVGIWKLTLPELQSPISAGQTIDAEIEAGGKRAPFLFVFGEEK